MVNPLIFLLIRLQPSDTIAIREKSKKQLRIKDALSVAEQYGLP